MGTRAAVRRFVKSHIKLSPKGSEAFVRFSFQIINSQIITIIRVLKWYFYNYLLK